MEEDDKIKKARNRVLKYCSVAERSEYDVRNLLQKYHLDSVSLTDLINLLKEEDFLNEERYVKAFIKEKFLFNKWGKIKITYALKQKKIKSALVEDLLIQEIDEDEYENSLTELLKAKKKTLKY